MVRVPVRTPPPLPAPRHGIGGYLLVALAALALGAAGTYLALRDRATPSQPATTTGQASSVADSRASLPSVSTTTGKSEATSGTAFATQPVVQLWNANNVALNQSGVAVTAFIVSSKGVRPAQSVMVLDALV